MMIINILIAKYFPDIRQPSSRRLYDNAARGEITSMRDDYLWILGRL